MSKASAVIKIFGVIMIFLLVLNIIRTQLGLGSARFEYFLEAVSSIETDFINSVKESILYAKSLDWNTNPDEWYINIKIWFEMVAAWISVPGSFLIGLAKYIVEVWIQLAMLMGFDILGNS